MSRPVLLVAAAVAAGAVAALLQRTGLPKLRSTILKPRAAPLASYAPRDFQTTCDPNEKPGILRLRDHVLERFGQMRGAARNISRGCGVGGKSEHKEGRAWDYFPKRREDGDDLIAELLATDEHGRPHALARKFGIQYMVWRREMWRAYDQPDLWHPYRGKAGHFDHIHFTISRKAAGALVS